MTKVNPFQVERLEGDKFLHYWPMIEKQLSFVPHIWQQWWTMESIREFVLSGRWQCWGVGTNNVVYGVVFSQIAMYPAQNVFQILLGIGQDLSEMVDIVDASLFRFATSNGCTSAEVIGRLGWEPHLRKLGFKRVNMTMAKKLETERLN